MSRIIYLEGSRAVGKTTLLKALKEHFPNLVVIDGYARKEFMFDTTLYDEFVINEKLYLSCAVAQYNVFKTLNRDVIIVKGPYTDAFYAETMLDNQFSDIKDGQLSKYIDEAYKCKPDMIIYLDASKDTVEKRCRNDSHIRKTMDIFMEKWIDNFSSFFKNKPCTKVINTDDLTAEEVFDKFIEITGSEENV